MTDLTAAQIGELITTALRANDSALQAAKINSALQHGGIILPNSVPHEVDSALRADDNVPEIPLADTPLELLTFRRAGLSSPQLDLVDALASGATLKRDPEMAAWVLTLKNGTVQRVSTNTVVALQHKGVLSA
ncbi:hypothetical protein ACFFLM_26605 [Deinococcus oregonensis]|uniref:Uncharacterized protein n=1 Tax=Deinococcus oregonensis TaxID=1805970 RepID=A0ABV6B6W0_9DEIO